MNQVRKGWIVISMAVFLGASRMAAAQGTGKAEVLLNRGIEALQRGDLESARGQFEAAVVLEPDFAAGHYFLGLTLLQSAGDVRTAARTELLERALYHFEQSRLRDPNLVLAYLDAGIAQTLLGRLEDAESNFQKLVEQRPNDPLPHLFLAIMYYRLGKGDPAQRPKALENLDKAEAAFVQSGSQNRSLAAHIRFYRGLVFVQERRIADAGEALRESRDADPEGDVGRRAADLLQRLQEGELLGPRPWELSLNLGMEWDSNVPLRGRKVGNPWDDKDDEDWRFGLSTDFTYRFVNTDEWLVGVGLNTFNSWHTDIGEFNVQTYGSSLFAGYSPPEVPWLSFGLRYDFDYSLLGNDGFLLRQRVTPQVDIQEADWTGTTLYYQFDARDYQYELTDPRLDRDGITHALGVIQDFELLEMFGRPLTAGVSYRYEDIGTDGTEFDSDNHIVGVGVGVPLPEDFAFQFGSQWDTQFYRNGSLFDADRSKRRDVINTLTFGLTKKFNEQLSARLLVEVTKDDSNVKDRAGREVYTYDRIIYGLSIRYQF